MNEVKIIMSANKIKRHIKLKMNVFIIVSILASIATTIIMFLGFYYLEPSRFNLFIISCITVMGYLISALYWDNYFKEWKELKELEQEIDTLLNDY